MEYFLSLPKVMQVFYSTHLIINKCKTRECMNTHVLPSSNIKILCSETTIRNHKKQIFNWMNHTKAFIVATRENEDLIIIYYVLPEWFEEEGKYFNACHIAHLRSKEKEKFNNLIDLKLANIEENKSNSIDI